MDGWMDGWMEEEGRKEERDGQTNGFMYSVQWKGRNGKGGMEREE